MYRDALQFPPIIGLTLLLIRSISINKKIPEELYIPLPCFLTLPPVSHPQVKDPSAYHHFIQKQDKIQPLKWAQQVLPLPFLPVLSELRGGFWCNSIICSPIEQVQALLVRDAPPGSLGLPCVSMASVNSHGTVLQNQTILLLRVWNSVREGEEKWLLVTLTQSNRRESSLI